MENKKKILIIGAGVSGLTAIKACKEGKLDVVCYEKSNNYGGLWRFSEDSTVPSVMKNTISNTSKEMSSFSDFPPSGRSPTYLPHANVMQYLESYADHFDLLGCITYSQEILDVTPTEDYDSTGKWTAKIRDVHSNETREEVFDGVMACVGHHHDALMPSYPNMDLFTGKIIHSSNYKSFEGLKNEIVVVVGAGNSGGDIAVEASAVAKKVYLSTRRGTWISPRLFEKGKPFDVVLNRRYRHKLPTKYVSNNIEKALNQKMDHQRYGLKPHHSAINQHPTINDEIQSKILTGQVSIKGDIKEFVENGIRFVDSDEIIPATVVIFATGFVFKFPFLNDDILRVGQNNKVYLFKNVFPPQLKHHSLAIIGLVQPSGSLFPVFETQSRWYVALMNGKCELPAKDKMLTSIRKTEGFRARAYVPSARHSIEEDWTVYMDELADNIGAKPNLTRLFFEDPKLFYACFFGPCLPYQYRLKGLNKWEGARDAILNYKTRLYEHLERDKK